MTKKNDYQFSEESELLEQLAERQAIRARTRLPKWAYVLVTILGLMTWWFWQTPAKQAIQEPSLGQQTVWSEKALMDLPIGLTKEQIEASYGLSTSHQDLPEINSSQHIYQLSSVDSVALFYDCDQGDCRLSGKSGFFLSSDAVEELAPGQEVEVWELPDYQELQVESLTLGQDGASLAEVLDKYGRPSDIVTEFDQLTGDVFSLSRLRLRYRPKEGPYWWLDLIFERQDNEPYRLVEKQAKPVEEGN